MATATVNQLVVDNIGLVDAIVSRRYRTIRRDSWQDLKSAGLAGLFRSAVEWRKSTGTPFSAYAARHIKWAIGHWLESEVPATQRNGTPLSECNEPVYLPAETTEVHELHFWVRLLPFEQRMVMELELAGASSGEIAEFIGIKPHSKSKISQRAREQLRVWMRVE